MKTDVRTIDYEINIAMFQNSALLKNYVFNFLEKIRYEISFQYIASAFSNALFLAEFARTYSDSIAKFQRPNFYKKKTRWNHRSFLLWTLSILENHITPLCS